MGKELKTMNEIDKALAIVNMNYQRTDLSQDQRNVLMGMSVALQWVADAGGMTLQRLVDGEKMAAGRTTKDLVELAKCSQVLTAIVLCDRYFTAIAQAWIAGQGRVVNESGKLITEAQGLDILADQAGEALARAVKALEDMDAH